MLGLYSSVFRFSHQRVTSAFPLVSKSRAVRLNQSTLTRYHTACSKMSDLFVELTAPNGRKYKQPRGLFINNEFVKSKSGETITSINPRYALFKYLQTISTPTHSDIVMRVRLSRFMQRTKRMSTTQWQQHAKLSRTRNGEIWTRMLVGTYCSNLPN